MPIRKEADDISWLFSCCGSGCSPWLLLCVFSLASIDIFNSCFSCPFRGSLKTFVHTVHLLQKQTELGSLPVADVLYRFVVTFLLINFSSSSENVLSPCRE